MKLFVKVFAQNIVVITPSIYDASHHLPMVGALICNQSIPVRIGVMALGNTHNANLEAETIYALGGLRSSTVKPASAHARIILQIILNECRKDYQCVMCNVAVVWKTQDRVFHIAFGSRRMNGSGVATQTN